MKDLGVQVGADHIRPAPRTRIKSKDLLGVLPGAWESTSRGDCFVLRKSIPLPTQHGRIALSGLPDLSLFDTLGQYDGISNIKPEEFLFIDTETTGLAGGAGTYVFLIGAAKYSQNGIEFSQFFLEDPASESAQLAALESFSSNAKALVSYNGKSFDLPRIKTRFLYHGWPTPFQDVYHIDLLHIARRLWKNHLPGCTLGDIERHLLELERDGIDIPGYQVSEHFYEYLHTGDASPLISVFYHNEIDVLSLAALLEYISERLSSPLRENHLYQPDLISIGKYLSFLRDFDSSKEVIAAALKNPDLPSPSILDGKLTLASIYKKTGDLDQAASLWKECVDMQSIESLVELAKYSEHTLSDYDEAIHWTLLAMEILESAPNESQSFHFDQLDHRLNRLKRKAKR